MAPKIDEHLQAIEKIAAIWGHFEFYVSETIWQLANVDRNAGACLTAQLIGPGPRFRALVALLHFRKANKDLIDVANSLTGRATNLGERRNRIVHDVLTNSIGEEVLRIHLKANQKLEFELKSDTLKDLEDSYQAISRLINDFVAFRSRMLVELPAFPRTQFELSPGIRTNAPEQDSSSQGQKPLPESSPD